VIGVVHQPATLIQERGLRFSERHAVLPLIRSVLPRVPFEPKIPRHRYSVNTR
jgi:hypothetical protein